jgi:hypothetical protein
MSGLPRIYSAVQFSPETRGRGRHYTVRAFYTPHDSRLTCTLPRPTSLKVRLYPVYTYMPLLPPLTNLPDAFDCAAVRAERMHDAVLIRSVYKEFGKYVRKRRKEGRDKKGTTMHATILAAKNFTQLLTDRLTD